MKDAHCVKRMKNQFFDFELWLIVFTIFTNTLYLKCDTDHKPNSFKSDQIYMKDAQCAEINEKSIFRFLVFEI